MERRNRPRRFIYAALEGRTVHSRSFALGVPCAVLSPEFYAATSSRGIGFSIIFFVPSFASTEMYDAGSNYGSLVASPMLRGVIKN